MESFHFLLMPLVDKIGSSLNPDEALGRPLSMVFTLSFSFISLKEMLFSSLFSSILHRKAPCSFSGLEVGLFLFF